MGQSCPEDSYLRFHLHEIFSECASWSSGKCRGWLSWEFLSAYRSLGPDLCALISFSRGVALSMCLCLLFLSLSICILRGALCLSQCLSSPHLHVCLSLCHCFLCPEGEDIPLWNMCLCSFLLLCPPECHMLQKGESFGLWR